MGRARLYLARFAGPAGVALIACGFSGSAAANPQGAVVMGGSAQIVQTSPTRLDINQTSNRAVIDWRSFSVGAGETTRFNQPSAASLAVNRVTGANPSDIAGHISANGQIVLVNPNGILFQRDSRIDAASFIATTSGISTKDAMAGNLAFTRPSPASTASVVNRGRITVKEGGLAALVAPGVVNDGVIRARLGKAVLAAGETFTIDLAGDRLVNFAVDGKVLSRVTAPDGGPLTAAIANSGRIIADGGVIEISVDAAKGVVDRAISMTGIAEARSVHRQQGAIVLDGGDAGNLHVTGRLDASGKGSGEVGGAIAVSGRNVALRGATLDASGAAGGGSIAVGGNALGAGPLRNAARTSIDRTSVLRADAGSTGNGGSVAVWSDRHTRFNGRISARGGAGSGDGGFAEVSSHGVLDFHGTADLRAPGGAAGTLLLDPNDMVIQTAGPSSRPLIGTSILTVADLQNQLALGNVSLTTGPSALGSQLGDITVASDVAWSSGNALHLSAHHDIAVNAKISSTNAGSVVLRADSTGTGSGTITFGVGGAIAASGGAVALYFNSNDNTNNLAINNQSYAATQSYAGKATLSDGATLNQFALVNTVLDLANINNNPAGSYALGRDIDASPIANFPMISAFSGLFDGQNHAIDKLTINSGGANVGLFADTVGGSSIFNVGLTNLSVTATGDNSNVGGLAGLPAGVIFSASTSGSVTAPAGAFAVGGLVGQTAQTGAGGGAIAQSSSSATVTGGSNAGGLVGVTNGANAIIGSFATGAVSSPGKTVGGLVGFNSGAILNSYATGAVSGDTAGGLVGREQGNSVTLFQVYATGLVTGNTAGGLVGQQSGPGTIANAYWDTTSTGQAEARGQGTPIPATGLTTAVLQNGTLPAGFDTATWSAKAGSYPTLTAMPGPAQAVSGTVFSGPDGPPLAGATVRLLVDGIDTGLVSTTDAGGGYSFALPVGTIPTAGGEVLAVVTSGGSGNAFFDGATSSLGNLDIYGGNFLTVYSGAATLSAAASGLHTASGGAAPPASIAGSLVFSPTDISALSVNPGAGLWLKPSAGSFSLDLPLGNSGATVLLSSAGSVSQTPSAAINIADGRLLLLGGGSFALAGGTTANNVGVLAASTASLTFVDGNSVTAADLTTGTLFGVAGIHGTGPVTISASRNLTLASGAPVSGSSPGTAVTLVAGGAFTNNAGANAIQPGGGGNFLVYSQNPANDTRGGLAYNFKQYNASFGSSVLGTGNGFLYRIAPTISLTAVTKTYDGTTALPFGLGGITASGTIDNDTTILGLTSGSYNSRNAGSGKNVTLTGQSTVTANDATGAAVFGYQLMLPSPLNTIGTITPAPLKVTAVPDAKVYDGGVTSSAIPTVTGLVGGDTLTGNLTESFNSRNAGSRTLSVNPGFVVNDGNGGSNYAINLVANTAGLINRAPLTIAAAPSTRIYDGGVTSSAIPTVTGLVGGDTLTGNLTESFNSRNAGSRTLSVNPGFVVNDGNGGNNYAINLVANTAGLINRAPLTIAAAPSTRTYDGGVTSSAIPTVTGLVGGDTLTGNLTESFNSRNAGSRTLSVNPGFVVNDGNGGNNYAINLVANTAGLINRAPLTIAAAPSTRTYDGGVTSSAIPTVTGLVGGDTLTGNLTESFNSRNAGSRTLSVNPGFVVNDGNGGNNYAINLVANTAGLINRAPLTIAAAPSTRTYDGGVTSSAIPTVTGLVGGDTLTGNLTESFNSRNAGSRTLSVNPGFVVNDGNGGNNYAINLVANTAGLINRAPLTIAAAPSTRTYDGGVTSSAIPTVTGLVGGDTLTGNLTESFNSRNAGSRTLSVNPGFVVNDGNGGNNYAISLVANTAGLINRAPLNVVATNASRDFGQPNPPLGGTVSGLAGGDTDAGIGLVYSTTATIASPPGAYPITAAIASGNYLENLIPGTLLVNPLQTIPAPPIVVPPTVVAPIVVSPIVTVSIANASTVIASVEQVSNTARQIEQTALASTLVPPRQDFVARIVEGFDTTLKAPRQALFVVLPNEDGTVGAISVDDGKTVTLLDKPYAALELRQGETVAAEFGPDDAELIFGRGKTARPSR